MTPAITTARAAYLDAIARHVDAEIADAMHDRIDYSPEAVARRGAISRAAAMANRERVAASLALGEAIRAAGGRP
jgi:hypothetical protein